MQPRKVLRYIRENLVFEEKVFFSFEINDFLVKNYCSLSQRPSLKTIFQFKLTFIIVSISTAKAIKPEWIVNLERCYSLHYYTFLKSK